MKILKISFYLLPVLLILFVLLLLLINFSFFRNLNIKEADVRTQINKEEAELNLKYYPLLLYIEQYNKDYGFYPETVKSQFDNIKGEYFEGYKYKPCKNKKCYRLEIYPKNGPIEYYTPNVLYSWRKGDGIEDGFLDNEHYYQAGKNWYAVHYDYHTRYKRNSK